MSQEEMTHRVGSIDLRGTERCYRLSEASLQAILAGLDLLLIFAAVTLAPIAYLKLIGSFNYDAFEYLKVAIEASAVAVLFLTVRRNYRVETFVSGAGDFPRYVQGWLAGFMMVLIEAFMTRTTTTYSRGGMLFAFIPGFLIAYGLRAAAHGELRRRMRRGQIILSSVLLIHLGSRRSPEEMAEQLASCGIAVAGVHRVPAAALGSGFDQSETALADAVNAARRLFASRPFDAIHVIVPWTAGEAVLRLRELLRLLPLPAIVLPDPLAMDVLQARPLELAGNAAFEIQRAPLRWGERAAKRLFDVTAAGFGLVLLSPLLVFLAAAVLVGSGRPIFFRQHRRGFGGRPFAILKLRTMSVQEDGAMIRQAERVDMRVTRIGAFLRRHSLDELPQLWNVLRGDMSLVGPRPHAEAHDEQYDALISRYALRNHVRPGITGWAQVNGYRGETRTVADMESRVHHDLWYIDNFSIRLDITILCRTVLLAFRDDAAY